MTKENPLETFLLAGGKLKNKFKNTYNSNLFSELRKSLKYSITDQNLKIPTFYDYLDLVARLAQSNNQHF